MIVMCHKPAQIINTARMSCDTIYLTIYNGPDLFKNFNEIYKCEHISVNLTEPPGYLINIIPTNILY